MSTYTRDGVEDLLSYMFNGGHWRREDAPDADMPKAKANPSHLGGNMAEMIDVKRAWHECYIGLRSPEALYLYYGNGLTVPNVSSQLCAIRETVRDHLVADVGDLLDEINTGRRRRARRTANLALVTLEIVDRYVSTERDRYSDMFADVLAAA